MEELRIKCPSCGIVLEVRNSQNEAVKRITCPNCKKQLAVTFHEEPKPAQYVEIKIVQLSDGSQKTIVRALTNDHIVCVNGEQLLKDDEVVLAPSDKLEIDGKLQFTPQVDKDLPLRPAPDTKPERKPSVGPISVPETKRPNWLLHVAIIVVIVAAFVLWRNFTNSKSDVIHQNPPTDTVVAERPLPQVPEKKKDEAQTKKIVKKDDIKTDVQPQAPQKSLANMSDYELERQAMSGNAEAQCVLGKRWVSRHDSINVVKGIKYLKLAASNGSSEARSALNKVYAGLQRSAANGSTTANNILREQR